MFDKLKCFFAKWKAKREERLWPERKIIVELGKEMIIAKYPDGKIVSADLNLLEKVYVETNDTGPWGADIWFIIISADGTCHFPQGATGEQGVLDFLLNLKGFDEKEFIKAMGSTSNASFLCWQKS